MEVENDASGMKGVAKGHGVARCTVKRTEAENDASTKNAPRALKVQQRFVYLMVAANAASSKGAVKAVWVASHSVGGMEVASVASGKAVERELSAGRYFALDTEVSATCASTKIATKVLLQVASRFVYGTGAADGASTTVVIKLPSLAINHTA